VKKVFSTFIGLALFIAGSAYTHRQAEYVASQSVSSVVDRQDTNPVSPQLKHTVVYQFVSQK